MIKKFLKMTLAVVGLILIIIVLFIGYIYFSSGKIYSAMHKINDIEINVEFKHAHLFLAEYKKHVIITKQGNVLHDFDLFIDPGGHAWVNLFLFENEIVIQDWGPSQYRFNMATNNIEEFWTESTENYKDNFIGRFKMDKRTLSFIPVNVDTYYDPDTVKGG